MTYLKAPKAGDTAPGIHILLIGVSRYFHLPGGRKKQFAPAADFPILDAPDFSCQALGDWLLNGNLAHPTLPIKSIEMLGSNIRLKSGAKPISVEKPNFANVNAAIGRWLALGDASPDNLLMFYFCGHGLQDGVTTHSLLCADFGADPYNPFAHAIHYEGFESGMRSCRAKKQVFLLDICRTTAPEITDHFLGPGSSVVGRLPPADITDVAQSVIWATSSGASAWARGRSQSVFAKAFIKCFEGGAATFDDKSSDTVANAGSIRNATAQWIKAMGEAVQEPQITQPSGQQFALHKFVDVQVPVFVRCEPRHRTREAKFSCWADGSRLKGGRAKKDYDFWQLDLSEGKYTFRAAFPGSVAEEPKLVYPPLIPVYIKV